MNLLVLILTGAASMAQPQISNDITCHLMVQGTSMCAGSGATVDEAMSVLKTECTKDGKMSQMGWYMSSDKVACESAGSIE